MKGQRFDEIKHLTVQEALLREAGFHLDLCKPEDRVKWDMINALAKRAVVAGLCKKKSVMTVTSKPNIHSSSHSESVHGFIKV